MLHHFYEMEKKSEIGKPILYTLKYSLNRITSMSILMILIITHVFLFHSRFNL